MTEQMKYCYEIVEELFHERHSEYACPFYKPVDIGLSDYYEVVKYPMDLGTVKGKLEDGIYRSISEFASDVRRVFTNCYKYYPSDHPLIFKAQELQHVFEWKFANMPDGTESPVPRIRSRSTLESSDGVNEGSLDSESSENEIECRFRTVQDIQEADRQHMIKKKKLKKMKKMKNESVEVTDEIDVQSASPVAPPYNISTSTPTSPRPTEQGIPTTSRQQTKNVLVPPTKPNNRINNRNPLPVTQSKGFEYDENNKENEIELSGRIEGNKDVKENKTELEKRQLHSNSCKKRSWEDSENSTDIGTVASRDSENGLPNSTVGN